MVSSLSQCASSTSSRRNSRSPKRIASGAVGKFEARSSKKILGFRLVGFPAARGLSLIVSIFSIIRSMGFRRSSLASWRAKHVRIRSKNKLFQHNGEPWRRSLHQHPRRSKWRGFEQCSNQPGTRRSIICTVLLCFCMSLLMLCWKKLPKVRLFMVSRTIKLCHLHAPRN